MLYRNDGAIQAYSRVCAGNIQRCELDRSQRHAFHRRRALNRSRQQRFNHQARNRGVPAGEHLHRVAAFFIWVQHIRGIIVVRRERVGSQP